MWFGYIRCFIYTPLSISERTRLFIRQDLVCCICVFYVPTGYPVLLERKYVRDFFCLDDPPGVYEALEDSRVGKALLGIIY